MVVSERWKRALALVREHIAQNETPKFPVDRLGDFEAAFLRDGAHVSLSLDEFIDSFSPLLENTYSRRQWTRLFHDIDANRSNTLEYDELSSFLVHQAVGAATDYARAKEFVGHITYPKLANAHKDMPRNFVALPKAGQFASGGEDGIVRLWNSEDLSFVRSVNNSRNCAAAELVPRAQQFTTPIVDIVSCGSCCAVATAAKCINLYQSEGFQLQRRYIGRNEYNDVSVPPLYQPGCSRPIDTVLLMGMADGISTADMTFSNDGREIFVVGTTGGSIITYPTMRMSLVPEVRPILSAPVHTGTVTRVRFEPSLNALISSGFDRALALTNAETGAQVCRFEGVDGDKPGVVGHMKHVTTFAYSARARLLASVACERDLCLWNPQMAAPVTKLSGHAGLLVDVLFNPHENQLVSVSNDNVIKVWDLRVFRPIQSLAYTASSARISALHYDAPSAQLLALAGVPISWRIRRSQSGFPAGFRGHIEPVVGVCYSQQTDSLVTLDHYTAMAWTVRNGERRLVWPAALEPNNTVAAALDHTARRLFVIAKDGAVTVVNHRSGQVMKEEKTTASDPVTAVYVARPPNNSYLAIVCPSAVVMLREVGDTELQHRRVEVPPAEWGTITCAAVGPPDSFGLPTVLCGLSGSSAAGMLTVSWTSESIVSAYPPPDAPGIASPTLASRLSFVALQRDDAADPMREFTAGRAISKQAEAVLFLSTKSLMLSVFSDRCIYFYSGAASLLSTSALEMSLRVREIPPGAVLVALAANTSETRLVAGTDGGHIVIYDTSSLPAVRRGATYVPSMVVPLRMVLVHPSSISRIVFLSSRKALVCLGADLRLRLVSAESGEHIGTFGEETWLFPISHDTFSLHAAAASAPVVEQHPTPTATPATRPLTSLTSTLGAGGGVPSFFLTGGSGDAPPSRLRRQPTATFGTVLEVEESFQNATTLPASREGPPLPAAAARSVPPSRGHTPGGRCLVPLLGARRRDLIVRPASRSSLLQTATRPTSSAADTTAEGPALSPRMLREPEDDLLPPLVARTPSPTRWKRPPLPEAKSAPPVHQSLVASLRSTFEAGRVRRDLDLLRPTTVVETTCRAEQRSETARRIFDEKRADRRSWCRSVMALVHVAPLHPTALDPPRLKERQMVINTKKRGIL